MSALRNKEIYHAPFFGEYGDASEEDDALAKQPEHRGYAATFDRIHSSSSRRKPGTWEEKEEEDSE